MFLGARGSVVDRCCRLWTRRRSDGWGARCGCRPDGLCPCGVSAGVIWPLNVVEHDFYNQRDAR